MKHTINNPLFLIRRSNGDFTVNKRGNYPTSQELVSKEVAKELLEALKAAKKVIDKVHSERLLDESCFADYRIINQAIKNANT